MDLGDGVLLFGAALLAGGVNAVAGGGSLISFPALLATGHGAVAANVTNNVALLPGYLGGSVGYRDELVSQRRRAAELSVTAGAGAAAGAVLLLVLPPGVFERIVPWLIFAACGLLAAQSRLRPDPEDHVPHPRALHAGTFVGCVYGGYFGAGLGIALLAILGLALPDDLHRLNALKGLLSLVVSLVAAIAFAIFGPVDPAAAALMAVGSLIGGRAGVAAARRLPGEKLRPIVVAFGVAVGIVLLVR